METLSETATSDRHVVRAAVSLSGLALGAKYDADDDVGGRTLAGRSGGPTGLSGAWASETARTQKAAGSMVPSSLGDSITIRDVSEGDRYGLRDLWAATWSATYAPLIGQAALSEMVRALTGLDLSAMLPPKNEEHASLAARAGRIVGSTIMAERGRVAFFWGMYVHPAEQRQGVGTALLGHVVYRLRCATSIKVRALESSP